MAQAPQYTSIPLANDDPGIIRPYQEAPCRQPRPLSAQSILIIYALASAAGSVASALGASAAGSAAAAGASADGSASEEVQRVYKWVSETGFTGDRDHTKLSLRSCMMRVESL